MIGVGAYDRRRTLAEAANVAQRCEVTGLDFVNVADSLSYGLDGVAASHFLLSETSAITVRLYAYSPATRSADQAQRDLERIVDLALSYGRRFEVGVGLGVPAEWLFRRLPVPPVEARRNIAVDFLYALGENHEVATIACSESLRSFRYVNGASPVIGLSDRWSAAALKGVPSRDRAADVLVAFARITPLSQSQVTEILRRNRKPRGGGHVGFPTVLVGATPAEIAEQMRDFASNFRSISWSFGEGPDDYSLAMQLAAEHAG